MEAATQAWIARCTGETVVKRDRAQAVTTSVAADTRKAVRRCFDAESTLGGIIINTPRDATHFPAYWATEIATRIVTGAR